MNRLAKRCGLAVAALVLAPAAPALAHHSFAMFDQSKIVTLEGTVHEFQWTNPHAWIELDVELNSPNNLTRQGWNRKSLKPGDKIEVELNPLRDGKAGGLFLDLTFPNGKKLDSGLPKNGKPVNVPQV